MVIHANHPAELRGPAAAAIGRLVDAGMPVLNQAVLLRGVNDDLEVLAALCERLDRSARDAVLLAPVGPRGRRGPFRSARSSRDGANRGSARRRLPGYAVPRYVREDGQAREPVQNRRLGGQFPAIQT